jgi:hypothetical protein
MERLRQLVAERRSLEGEAGADRLRANKLEVDRLQHRLADVVRRELNQSSG